MIGYGDCHSENLTILHFKIGTTDKVWLDDNFEILNIHVLNVSFQFNHANLNSFRFEKIYTTLLHSKSSIFPHIFPFTLRGNVVVFCCDFVGGLGGENR